MTGLQVLKNTAMEAALRTLVPRPSIVNTEWKVDAHELSDVSIEWPTTYQWPDARIWVDTLLAGFKKRVHVKFAPIAQPYRGVVNFRFIRREKANEVIVDYSDYPEINEEAAARCPVYFKMQHLRDGYARANVLPGGYVSDSRSIYLWLSRLRRMRDRRQFDFDVYGRFSTEFAAATRRRAVELLSAQKSFRFEGGLKKVKYLDFLKEIARAKVCIDLPGEGDFCFRLVNYLAVGACVVGPRHRTVLNAQLVDGVHIAYTKDDLSDLVELCQFYLENAEAREAMCRSSRDFFEKYLHVDNLTAYYLRACLDGC
jgi:hypothetical protein